MAAVTSLIHNADTPLVMFGLEWCEFCWSVRKVLKLYGVPCHFADLDTVTYQQDNMGTKMRGALRSITGWNTFPQIFLQGEFIGGCTDLFDGLKDRSFLRKLEQNSIPCNTEIDSDPYTLLPGWLHPR
ncbi:glutaredoxin [Pseudomaricurvus hydrocarbonicus]